MTNPRPAELGEHAYLEVMAVLTIARMHSESVAYYESTVDSERAQNPGPDVYYSEDGTRPAQAWVVARTEQQQAEIAAFLGTKPGVELDGSSVQRWFNRALAPSGNTLGRRPGERGVPGFDLTFCAPKSVSLVWGLSDSEATREAVNQAHAQAVDVALDYLVEHAGYTRKASDWNPDEMVIDRVEALSGVRYEHRTSRAGDPHVHSHVLVANRQLCADGKARSLDSKSLFHEARAAGMVYQSVLRSTLTQALGVQWGAVTNGCAEIAGLDDPETIKAFSTRMREIDLWKADNGLDSEAGARMGQKITRQAKDTDTSLAQLRRQWADHAHAAGIREVIAGFRPADTATTSPVEASAVPTPAEVITAVTRERSTFTRADLVEKTCEMLPTGAVEPDRIHARVEAIVDEIVGSGIAWSVNPEAARSYTTTVREGSQRFTAEPVIEEINDGIDLACARVDRGVSALGIRPIKGQLSENQARAMRTVVSSPYRASVIVAPAGAGKTSSLKAARTVWERAGKTVVGLAPTGKAADVMVREDVAHSSATIARALVGTKDLAPDQVATRLGWDQDTVLVVDEAGMVATPDIVRLLQVAHAADARVVLVGDPHQYAAVKARSGMLATLAYELPDAVELDEVFRQKDPGERRASQWLRDGNETDTARAADWYARKGRLHAGSTSAMLTDALTGWVQDTDRGYASLLVAATTEDVEALNLGAQQVRMIDGALNDAGPCARLAGAYRGYVGDVVVTRRNDYDLVSSTGEVVRNGQRWEITATYDDGSISARRHDDTVAAVRLPAEYVRAHVQLGYACTGHSAQGATVDTCHVVTGVGQVDRAGVYVPLTRGKHANHLYLMEKQAGDPDTAHSHLLAEERRETSDYARDLLLQAAAKDRADISPHQLWRGARRDFELARLSSNQRTDVSPFDGTAMATVMAKRQVKRRARFEDFFRAQAKKGDKQATPTQIVRVSLATRPLADVSDELLETMLTTPEQIRTQHVRAAAEKDRVAGLVADAQHAHHQLPELQEQLAEYTRGVQRAGGQLRQAREELAGQENRSVLGRVLHGGMIRQARAHAEQATERSEQAQKLLEQARGALTYAQEVIAQRPTPEQVTAVTQQEVELSQLVSAVEDSEMIRAECTWRAQATGEIAQIDQHRRELAAVDIADELVEGPESWDRDRWARLSGASSGVGAGPEDQSESVMSRELEDGMDL